MNTLTLRTNQQVFNFVRNHLLTQNEKSLSVDDHMCMYKSDDNKNLSCAIGCLIPKELYSSNMERKGLSSDVVIKILQKSLPNWKIDFQLLESLQSIHDSIDIKDWDYALGHLKKDYTEYGDMV